jgi:hypothetical protein
MATTKITDLTAYTDPVNTDVLPIVDVTSDVTKKVSIANVMKNASLGTAAAPAISFDGDPNTGIYSPGADQVAVTTGGTQRLLIDSAGAVTIAGDLTVNGTTTNINTTNLVIEDKNIILGDVTTPTDVTADGGGITLKGTTDKTINWVDSTDAWTSSERFSYPLGSAAAPTLTFTGDANTGIYSPGADQVAISTSGTGRLFVDANGNVGVGAASPVNNAGYGGLTINGADGAILSMMQGGAETFRVTNATGYSFINTTGATPLLFGTGANERMRLTSAGLLGLGTTLAGNANNRLLVRSDSASAISNVLLLNNGPADNNAGQGVRINLSGVSEANSNIRYAYIEAANQTSSNDHYLAFGTNSAAATPTERLRITSAGNVGIGVTGPSYSLDVNGVIQARSGASLILQNDTGNDNASIRCAGSAVGAASLLFNTAGSERARIDSSGRLLVGTSSARTNFYNQASTYTPKVQIESATGSSGDTMAAIISSNAGGFGGYLLLAHQRSGTIGGNTILNNADVVGSVSFQGSDGSEFVECATVEAYIDGTPGANDMPGRLVFSTTADGASSPTERMRIRNDGSILIQQTALSSASDGCYFNANTPANFHQLLCHSTATSSLANLYLNRQGSDGTLIDFRQADTTEGSVSVSGTTVSFNGGHLSRWSQLPNEEDPSSILKGTVMSNLDEMCEWGEEDNEQLNKTKVSDVEGDPNVAGVFVATSFSEDGPLDFYLAMTGDMIIRIAEGVTVQRGQLLMSAGDGTAKPQGDGFVQDKTIAKVTSTHVTCTYDDGSYCVPCVLMAC